jgi:hypothetical protein
MPLMPPAEFTLIAACRTLFGNDANLGPEFLAYLQPSGAKVAFRIRAKEHHPDRFACAPQEIRAQQTERFREIHQAYTLLSDFLSRRHRSPTRPVGARPSPVQNPGRTTQPQATSSRDYSAIPPIPMEFGIFAYYRGLIEYRDLIDALVWQRRQRPTLGAIACQWGWLNEGKVRGILGHRGHGGRFGRKAVELGLLNSLQVDALLRHQRTHQQRLGQYFIERGLITANEADQLARDLERHNLRFTGGRR